MPGIKNVQKAFFGWSYSTVAYAFECETLIAFTYDVVRNFWHRDGQTRSEKTVEEDKKKRGMKKKKSEFFNSKVGPIL